jgi:hypothetical protein
MLAAAVHARNANMRTIPSQRQDRRVRRMVKNTPAFVRDPVTWTGHELVASYRSLARYRGMAEAEARSLARTGLLELAQQCDAAAEGGRRADASIAAHDAMPL